MIVQISPSTALRDYEWQMSVYAELYKAKSGGYPTKAILYFLNELRVKQADPPITKRPVRAMHVVDFTRKGFELDGTPKLVKEGLDAFDVTAGDILACKAAQRWDAPIGDYIPDDKTCDICDIRWNCPAHPTVKYQVRLPI